MSATKSTRPTAPARIGAFLNMVTNAFGRRPGATVGAGVDTSDVWTLYRMTRRADTVPQEVIARLAKA
jgi:hypothetical protein